MRSFKCALLLYCLELLKWIEPPTQIVANIAAKGYLRLLADSSQLLVPTMSMDEQLESCGQRRKQTDALQLGPRKRPWVTVRN
jgi:hypothetical protein